MTLVWSHFHRSVRIDAINLSLKWIIIIVRVKCEFYMKKLHALQFFQNKQMHVFHSRVTLCISLVNTRARG